MTATELTWPMWRCNRNRTGYAPELGPSEPAELRWSFDVTVPDIVAGPETVYALSSTLYALDASTGTVKWSQDIDSASSFALDQSNNRLCVVSDQGTIRSFSLTGSQEWVVELEEDIIGPRESVLLQDGDIYITTSESIFRLDGKTGDIKGRWNHNGVIECLTASDEDLFLAGGSSWVGKLDAITGGIRWTNTYEIDPEWNEEPHSHGMWLAIQDDTLYLRVRGRLIHIDSESGTEQYRKHVDPFFCPAVTTDRLYIHYEDTIAAIDAETKELLWHFDEPNTPLVHPVANDRLVYTAEYVGDEATIFALYLDTGDVVWKCRDVEDIYSLVLGKERLYAQSGGYIHAFG